MGLTRLLVEFAEIKLLLHVVACKTKQEGLNGTKIVKTKLDLIRRQGSDDSC